MKTRLPLAVFVTLSLFLATACQSTPTPASAQAIIDRMVAKNSQIVRLTLHVVPRNSTDLRVLASNTPAKLVQPSDREDIECFATGRMQVITEGDNLDVTLPIIDVENRRIAVAGVTLRRAPGRTQDQIIADARAITEELRAAILAAPQKLW